MLETYVRGGIDLVAAAKNKASDKGDFASRMLALETTLNNVKDNSDETRLNSLRELAEELVGNSSLTDALNTLSAENLTKINTLTNQLNTEINRAKGMENTISSTITDGLADLIAQLNTEITNRQNADTSVSGQLTTKHNTALSTLNSGVTEMNASDGVIQTNISSLRNADTSINNEISGIKNKNLGQDTVLYELVKDFAPNNPADVVEGRQPAPEMVQPEAEIINNNWAHDIEGLYHANEAPTNIPEGYVRFEDADKKYAVFFKKEYGNSGMSVKAEDIPSNVILPSVSLISNMKQLGITRDVSWKQADGSDYPGASDLWPAEQIKYHWTKEAVDGVKNGTSTVDKIWAIDWLNLKLQSRLTTHGPAYSNGLAYLILYTG